MTSFPFAWTGPKSFSVVGNTATPRAASSGSGTVDPSSRNVTSGSKNADLHTRSSSPDIVKVKPEIGDVLTVQQETWRLDVVEVKQENWDEGECVPVETTLTLQAQLKEATDLGAKTLQERLEVETALEKSRQECVDMQAALIAERKASEDRHTATLLEMEDLVERLEEKGRETADLVKMVENLSRRCDESDKARAELEEKIALVPNKEIFEVVEANAKYRKFMNELPNPEMPPPSFAQLEAICSSSANLYGYLSQNPAAQRFLSHILYLPKRLLSLPQSQLDYLAYGPTACYEASTQRWVDGSDLVRFHGGTRELFVEREGSIVYAGTYLCHDLRELHPAGTPPPADILPRTIIQAAFGALPYNHGQLIKQRYLDGKIKVEATGLKCVGFNIELYDVLRKRLAQEREKREKQKNKEVQKEKRKAGNEDLREGEKNKKSLLDFDF